MKKLLIITDLYPHNFNQISGIFVQHQVLELSRYFEVKVILTCFPYKYEFNRSWENGIEISRISFPYWLNLFLTSILTYRLFAIPQIKKLYSDWCPDIIHVHDCRHLPELLILRTWLNKIEQSQFLTLHNIRTHPNRMSDNRFHWLYKATLSFCLRGWTHIFTVNTRLSQWVKSNSKADVTVIGNAIQPTGLSEHALIDQLKDRLKPESFKLISVGNLVTEKGFDYLIRAVSSLRQNEVEVQLIIVGDGPDKERLEALVSSLSLTCSVTFTGSMDNTIVRNLYLLFDAFVLPSYSETFGIVYLEAMYAGVPVIGIAGQGIDGIVSDGVNGLLAKPQDTTDLAQKILFLIQNPQSADQMAKAGSELVKSRYMLPGLIQRIMDTYAKS